MLVKNKKMNKKLSKIKSFNSIEENIENMFNGELNIVSEFKTEEDILYYILENKDEIKIQMIASNVEITKKNKK